MAKIKVYELAKELNVSSKEVVEFLGEKNIEVKSHMSSLEEADAEIVRKSGRGTEEKKYCAGVPSSEYEEWKQNGKASGRKAGSFSGKTDAGE